MSLLAVQLQHALNYEHTKKRVIAMGSRAANVHVFTPRASSHKAEKEPPAKKTPKPKPLPLETPSARVRALILDRLDLHEKMELDKAALAEKDAAILALIEKHKIGGYDHDRFTAKKVTSSNSRIDKKILVQKKVALSVIEAATKKTEYSYLLVVDKNKPRKGKPAEEMYE